MRFPALLVTICFAIVAGPSAGAQVATPDPSGLPDAAAPLGLDSAMLPATWEEVEALIGRLPGMLDGERINAVTLSDGRMQVSWGAEATPMGYPLALGVHHFPDGDFFPADFTAGAYVAMTLQTDEMQVIAGGRDGDLAWVQAAVAVGASDRGDATPVVAGTLHTLVWGRIDGPWLFTAAADTPARVEALVRAFVEAAAAPIGATPAAGSIPLRAVEDRVHLWSNHPDNAAALSEKDHHR